jgi:N-acyl homoserine lactone hydrolase
MWRNIMRLYVLQMALLPANGMPAVSYLIQTDDDTNVLVDTGFPKGFSAPSRGVQLGEQDFIVSQLATLGLVPDDIRYLVCTHFDQDHAGAHDAFPNAELIVQRQHYDVARSGEYERFERMRAHWDHPGLRYRLVDGDTMLLPGIELVETSGHVPGHQSVLVRLPETGPVLLTIDAVTRASHFDSGRQELGPHDMDAGETLASTRKLVARAQREGVGLVIFGHDAEQWPTLKRAPECYQ